MKLVGVMGQSGSGKTTFTNFLGENKSVGIIHVDDLVGKVKQRYFKLFLQRGSNNTYDHSPENKKLNSKVKSVFYKNKLLFKFLMALRSKLIQKDLEKAINNFKGEGKELVIIDDWALITHKKLYSELSKVYIISRNFAARRNGLKLRDNATREELKLADIPHALQFIKYPENSKVQKIINNSSLEDLQIKAKKELEKLVVPNFEERIHVEAPTVIQTLEWLAETQKMQDNIKE